MPRHVTGRRVTHGTCAFSLVELVMVVTILGILAAIAMPRMTSAATSADAHALEATLTNVRKAIDTYYAEHDRYPGYDPGTGSPDDDAFVDQLLMYSDANGKTQATRGYPFLYGPYLRSPFPANPLNKLRTVKVKATPSDGDPAEGSVGWIAVLSHGYFGISATDADLERIASERAEFIDDARGGATKSE